MFQPIHNFNGLLLLLLNCSLLLSIAFMMLFDRGKGEFLVEVERYDDHDDQDDDDDAE